MMAQKGEPGGTGATLITLNQNEQVSLRVYLTHRPIDSQLALEWLLQLAEILDEVHQQQFFHRDIKPPNIILRADGQLVLIDFGTVRAVTPTYFKKQPTGQVTKILSAGAGRFLEQLSRKMPFWVS